MTEVRVMLESKEHIFKFLTCPFSGVDPEIIIDPPIGWEGMVIGYIRVINTNVEASYSVKHFMNYGYFKDGNLQIVKWRSLNQTIYDIVSTLELYWNTRKEPR